MKTLLRNVFFCLLLFLLSLKLQAQTDSVIYESCINYYWDSADDTTLAIDSFDVATGLIHSHTSGNNWVTYSYNQYNLCDTSYSHSIVGDYRTIYLYTAFQKDSIVTNQLLDSATWNTTGQYLYVYDSLQFLFSLTELTFNGDTVQTTFYSYSGNNIDSVLIIKPSPDTSLLVYIYDTSGSYSISYFHWEDGAWDTLPEYRNYNSQGQVMSYYDGWSTVVNTYDSLGRLIISSGEDPHDGGSFWETTYVWGCNGFLSSTDYWYISTNTYHGSHCEYYYPGTRQFYIHLPQGYGICFGDTSHLNNSIILGTAPYTYAWTPSAGLSSDTVLSPDAFPDSTTTYYLTATDSAGDIFQECVTVIVHPMPQISIYTLDSTNICYGDTIDLFASVTGAPDATISWYNGNNSLQDTSSLLRVSQSGSYHANVITSFGCSDQSVDTIDVSVSQASHLSVSYNNHVCIGDTAIFKVIPPSSPYNNYQWYVDSLIIPGATDSVYATTQAGNYYLYVTCDTSVCTWTSDQINTTFSVQPIPDIIPNADTIVCQGDFILRTTRDSTWGYAYLLNSAYHSWPGWQGDSVVLNIFSPTEIQIVAYNNGCPGYSDSIFVDVYPQTLYSILSSPIPPYCEGDSVQLSTSVTGLAYLWSTQETDSIIYVDTTGFYSLHLTDTNGCDVYRGKTITFNPMPPVPVIGYNGTALFSDTAFTMQWYLDGVAIAGATDSAYLPIQDGFYTYEVGNSYGCYAMSAQFYFSAVGIDVQQNFKNVFIRPAITRNSFELINPFADISSSRFDMFSTAGELVFTKQISEEITSIYQAGLKPGMYFWKLYSQNNQLLGAGKIIFIE